MPENSSTTHNQGRSFRTRATYCLIVLSIVFGAITLTSTWVTHYDYSDWGLVSKLPLVFWLGLLTTIATIFVGRKSTRVLAASVILVILYLYAIPTLVNEHSIEFTQTSYFTYGEGLLLAEKGELITEADTAQIRYHDWPAFLYLSADMYLVTGIKDFAIPQYFPILTASLIALFGFLTLRIFLGTRLALIGTIFALAINFQPHIAFLPQGLGILLMLTLMFMVARSYSGPSGTRGWSSGTLLSIFLLLGVIAMTHALTSLTVVFILSSTLILSFLFRYKQNRWPLVPLIVISTAAFIGYVMFAIPRVFEQGVTVLFMNNVEGQGTHPIANVLRLGTDASRYYDWTIMISFAIVAICALIGALAILRALGQDRTARINQLFCIAWILGLVVIGSFAYQGDGFMRAFTLGAIPIGFLCTSLLRTRTSLLLIILAVLLVAAIPAHYGNLVGMQRTITTTELAGRDTFARCALMEDTYFYGGNTDSWYTDPVRANSPCLVIGFPPMDMHLKNPTIIGWPDDPAAEVILKEADYIIDSDLERSNFEYFLGYDFMDTLETENWGNCWYDSSHMQIYKSRATQ